jgi:transposase InsO family protein
MLMDPRNEEQRREPDGAESGTPGEAPSGLQTNADTPPARRRHHTGAERLALVLDFRQSGVPLNDFAPAHGISPSTLHKWVLAFKDGGPDALESRPNRRNSGGHYRGRYSPEERRRIVEAFHSSGLGQREFSRTWGVAVKSLGMWLARYEAEGPRGLESRPRTRNPDDPRRVPAAVREEITRTQARFPDFGMRKVRDFLRRFQGISVSANSVRKTLNEAGIPPQPPRAKRKRRRKQKDEKEPRRFERASRNQLWQSDITSFLLTRHSTRVYLTVFLDDCSRYVVSWALATHQRQELVNECLMEGIARFGKPEEVLTDQGRQYFAWRGKSDFQKLLVREGIEHVVSRTHHPETLGKCERLWDTINRELWERTRPQDLGEARERLGHWFAHYNHFRPHQGIEGLVPADRFFDAKEQVRQTIEASLAANEMALALGEPLRKPVFLFGQIGDQAVSLHGERGRLVLQTSDCGRKEVGLDEIGMPNVGEEHGNERSRVGGGSVSGIGTSQAHTALQEARAVSAAQADPAREGVMGVGQRRGTRAGAPDVLADDRVLAGSQVEGGDGGAPGATGAARVAIESVGAVGHARGPAEATEGPETRSGRDGLDERAVRTAQGERSTEEGARADADPERAPEGPAAEPTCASDECVEERGRGGEKKAAEQDSTRQAERSSAGDCLSTGNSQEDCWIAWLERST